MATVLVDADSGRMPGATVFGTGGDEVISRLAAWMYTGLPYTELQKVALIQPTDAQPMPHGFENLEPLEGA